MGQHPDPDEFHDQDLDDELGRPVYQGDGLSVRELTAEELQRFLDVHADQPAELLGSGWATLDPPPTLWRPGPLRPRPRRCRPSRSPAAWAAPAARPGRLPATPRRRAGRLEPQPGLAGAAGRRRRPRRRPARRPGQLPRPGWSAWLWRRWSAGGCGFGLRAGPHLAARRPRGAAHRPPAGAAHPRRLRGLPRPCGAREYQRERRSSGHRPKRRVRDRQQAVDRQRPPGRRRAGLAQPLPA